MTYGGERVICATMGCSRAMRSALAMACSCSSATGTTWDTKPNSWAWWASSRPCSHIRSLARRAPMSHGVDWYWNRNGMNRALSAVTIRSMAAAIIHPP